MGTAPLILGNDVRNMSSECKNIVLNKEVLAVNQDANVQRGRLVQQWPDAEWRNETELLLSFAGAAPPPTAAVAVAPCDAANKSQQWLYNKTDSTIRAVADTSLCITYSGYHYNNVGLAPCKNWSAPGIGSQLWDDKTAIDGTLRVVGSSNRCLAPLQCAGGAAIGVADCAATGISAGDPPACPGAERWTFNEDGGALLLTSGIAASQKMCAVLSPVRTSNTNITLQIWAKALADGSVAALAFNRGQYAIQANLSWSRIGIPLNATAHVRDLWAQKDLGSFRDGYTATVQPHDVVFVRLGHIAPHRDVIV